MPKSIVELKIEERKLGRVTLQIPGQEDTLKLLEQKGFASETTLLLILAQLDITLSSLRDALRGSGAKNFTTLETDAEAILSRLNTNLSTRASEANQAALASILALILGQLDVDLSTRASEATLSTRASQATLASVLSRLDTALSTRASQTTLASVLTRLDVALSTRASETTLATLATEATLAAQLDITLSALADAITGAGTPKDLKDLWDKLNSILGQLDNKTSTLATQATLALIKAKTDNLDLAVTALRDALRGGSDKNFTTLEAELANKINKATTATEYTLTMTLANTEYPQVLPADTKRFQVKTRDGTAFRLAFVTDKVAGSVDPYNTVPTGVLYWEDLIEPSTLTLYFACSIAAKKVEIIAWS